MSAAPHSVTMTVRFGVRRWLRCWLYAIVAIHHFTGWSPAEATRTAAIRRGVYVERIK
jgi:hypothetical protein